MTTVAKTRTTTALLNGLHDAGNDAAWRELLDRCQPIMRATAARMGLSGADADDVVQTAMVTFIDSYRRGQYDRTRGRLSGYLITILRSRAIELMRSAGRRRETQGGQAMENLPNEDDLAQLWDEARQKQILEIGIQELRDQGADERMLHAFELYGLRSVDVKEVSAQLCMTREEIYNAKYRIAKRLQPIVAQLDEIYEDL